MLAITTVGLDLAENVFWTCLGKVESSSVKDEVFNVRTEEALYA